VNAFDYAIMIGALGLEIMAFMYAVELYINKMLRGRDNGDGSLRV
jgi:hypothetical protein